MNPSSSGLQGWKITASGEISQLIKTSLATILSVEKRARVSATLEAAIQEIKRDPRSAGGPRFRYHHLDLLNYVYPTEYFILHYAVDEKRHLIYLRKFVLMAV